MYRHHHFKLFFSSCNDLHRLRRPHCSSNILPIRSFCLAGLSNVIFQKSTFFSIDKICNTLNDFAIIAPTFNDQSIFKNYIEKNVNKSRTLNIDDNKILEVKEVDGAAFVVNKDKFKEKVMDDKIFMYFESKLTIIGGGGAARGGGNQKFANSIF